MRVPGARLFSVIGLAASLGAWGCGETEEESAAPPAAPVAAPTPAAPAAPTPTPSAGQTPQDAELLRQVQAALTEAGHQGLTVEVAGQSVNVSGTNITAEQQAQIRSIVEPLAFDRMYRASFAFSS